MGPRSIEHLLTYPVTNLDAASCIQDIALSMEKTEHALWLSCLNPHSYVMATREPQFESALRSADWLVPDGVGIVLASRVLGGSIRERVTGTDIFVGLHNYFQLTGGATVFLLGSTDENLYRIRSKMEHQWPAVRVVGTYSPPFKAEFSDSDIDCMLLRVNEVQPDVLWVGISAPKQEKLLHHAIGRLNVRFAAAIGAAFDFYSGRVRRSHPHFQRFGLEWLPRLMREPSRVGHRTFVSAPIFLWHVLRARISLTPSGT